MKSQITVESNPLFKLIKTALIFLFFVFVGLFYLQKINIVTADLGRHIKNGEYFIQNLKIIQTNFYSYTETNYPAINHHWGAEVIFYLVWKLAGFEGLTLFHELIYIVTFLLFSYCAYRLSNLRCSLFFYCWHYLYVHLDWKFGRKHLVIYF